MIRIISQSELTGLITPRQLNLCLWAWIDRMKNRAFPYITRLNTTNLCFGAFNSTPFNAFASSDHKSNSCLQLSYPNNATKVTRKFYWFNEIVFSKIRPAPVALFVSMKKLMSTFSQSKKWFIRSGKISIQSIRISSLPVTFLRTTDNFKSRKV